MTAKELIKKYDIKAQQKLTDHGYELTGNVMTTAKMTARERQEVSANIPEIKRILFDEWNARKQAAADRQAKIDAIEGLKEIRKAMSDAEEWNYKFAKSFEGEYAVGGMGTGNAPKTNISDLMQRYPRAAAYIKADEYASKMDCQLSEIGSKAKERIINEPDNYDEIVAEMEQEIKANTADHLWD